MKNWLKENLNFKSFWKVLPFIFTWDFWFLNKKLKGTKYGCFWRVNINEIKKWAKKKGYYTSEGWYLDGEKFLYKNGVKLCMIQPYDHTKFTREYGWQPNHHDGVYKDRTFLLNHHKTAKALFQCLNEEQYMLFQRDILCDKINDRIAKKDKKYLKSNEFLTDLAHLSFSNYYDILDLRHDSTFSLKEKKQYIGDYCDYQNIILGDYLSYEEAEEMEKAGYEFDWNWTADFIPTALTRSSIDSVLCINPNKIHGLKVTPELLKRMHNLFFKGL